MKVYSEKNNGAYLRKGKNPFLLLLLAGLLGAGASLVAWQRMRRASLSSISRVLRFAISTLSDNACKEGLTMSVVSKSYTCSVLNAEHDTDSVVSTP